jgi:SAM-dependent methyltransferase
VSAEPLRFDAAAASAYERFMGRWSRLYVPALLAGARITTDSRVLDVAAGTGEAALLAASWVGLSGKVVGTDISLPMLRTGQNRLAGKAITLVAMDAQVLALRDRVFDAVICQLGLMFFPDVARGLGEFRRVLRPGGRTAVCVWSTPERSPLIGILAEALSRHAPAQRDDLRVPFSLSDPGVLEGLLVRAGFQEVRITRETRPIAFESFEDYWGPVEEYGGRMGQIYKGLSDEARRAVREEVRQRMSGFQSNGRLVMEVEALFGLASADPDR